MLREDLPHIRRSEPVNHRLFHLDDDLGQQRDLTEAEPEVLARLKARLRSLHREVMEEAGEWDIPPDYGTGRPRRVWDSE